MKFLPPEEEIRAQLRELTSKTRRLRADLQGLIDDKTHSDSPFAREHRRLSSDRQSPYSEPRSIADDAPRSRKPKR